jgi:hypothetical protein
MKLKLFIAVFLTSLSCHAAQNAANNPDEQFVRRFENVRDTRYENGQLQLLATKYAPWKIGFAAIAAVICGYGSAAAFEKHREEDAQPVEIIESKKSRWSALKALGWTAAAGTAACVAWISHHLWTAPKQPKMVFDRHGLHQDGERRFTWQQYQGHRVEDVYEDVAHTHKATPDKHHRYEYSQTRQERTYKGRQVICQGRHQERLMTVPERNWMPIRFNDFIDTLEHYRGQYGQAAQA